MVTTIRYHVQRPASQTILCLFCYGIDSGIRLIYPLLRRNRMIYARPMALGRLCCLAIKYVARKVSQDGSRAGSGYEKMGSL